MKITTLEEKTISKEAALNELTKRLNSYKDYVSDQIKKYNEKLKQEQVRFFEELDKLNSKGKPAEVNFKEALERISEESSRLETYRKEIESFASEQSDLELKLNTRDEELTKEEDVFIDLWVDYTKGVEAQYRRDWQVLDARSKLQDSRAEALRKRELVLRDRLNSFAAARKELTKGEPNG